MNFMLWGSSGISRSTAMTSNSFSAKKRAWRPPPQATSSTGPRATRGAQRTTQSEGSSRRLGGRGFGIGPVLIVAGLAVEHHEDKQHDPADERYQEDEDPPAGAIRVVQPAHRDADRRQQDRERIEHADDAGASEHPFDKGDHHRDDQVDEKEHPVFLAPGPPLELGVLLQHFQVPVHCRPPLVSDALTGYTDVIANRPRPA